MKYLPFFFYQQKLDRCYHIIQLKCGSLTLHSILGHFSSALRKTQIEPINMNHCKKKKKESREITESGHAVGQNALSERIEYL